MKRLFNYLFIFVLLLNFSCNSVDDVKDEKSRKNSVEKRVAWNTFNQVSDLSESPDTFRDLIDISPDTKQSLISDKDWYKDAIFYHVWVNAFSDSDGDGIGDINGITQKISYFKDLGITALWLSPFFESASTRINLHMYDTIDHYKVDPRFGTNNDIDNLLKTAHDNGIRVIFDWVPNHISEKSQWFIDSVNKKNNKEDWFVWRGRPGSQEGPWGQSVWHRKGERGYYYGVFWSGMPDINFRHQAAKDAITNVALYWLNKGFDGMRVDAVKYLYEDERSIPGGYENLSETKEYYTALRKIIDKYSETGYNKFMVSENWTNSRSSLEEYMVYNDKEAFHMTLDFPFMTTAGNVSGVAMKSHWNWVANELDERAWMGTFISNHDNASNRPASRHGLDRMRIPVAMNILGVGTPFIYYGNEIAMPDASQFAGQAHADRRHRQPFEWEKVDDQKGDKDSILEFHRDLITIRNKRVSLRRGDFTSVDFGDRRIFAYIRDYNGEKTLVMMNTSPRTVEELSVKLDVKKADLIYKFGLNDELIVRGSEFTGNIPGLSLAIWKIE